MTPEWFRDRLFTRNPNAFTFVQKPSPDPSRRYPRGGLLRRAHRGRRRRGNINPDNVSRFAMTQLARFDVNAIDLDVLRRLLLRPVYGWGDGRLGRGGSAQAPVFWTRVPQGPRLSSRLGGRSLDRCPPSRRPRLGARGVVRRVSIGKHPRLARRCPPVRARRVGLRLAAAAGGPGRASVPQLRRPDHDQGLHARRLRRRRGCLAGRSRPGRAAPSRPSISEAHRSCSPASSRRCSARTPRTRSGTRTVSVASSVNAKLALSGHRRRGFAALRPGQEGVETTRKARSSTRPGRNIRIISETAFLKMLSGRAPQRLHGRRRRRRRAALGDGHRRRPGRRPARAIRGQVHPPPSPGYRAGRDRSAVDPGAEIPAGFLSFDRVKPLFAETAQAAARPGAWNSPGGSSPAGRRRPTTSCCWPRARTPMSAGSWRKPCWPTRCREHRRYRIDPESLTAAAVFRFCESLRRVDPRAGDADHRSARRGSGNPRNCSVSPRAPIGRSAPS